MIAQYLYLAKNIFLSNGKRLSFPYKLTFAVTYRCNSRCKTCNIWKKKNSDELTVEEIERFFATANNFSWIDLTGGEPSLRKDFAQICATIHEQCKRLALLHFPTNGYLTEKIIRDTEAIRSAGSPGKTIITVSTDGNEALNDEIRGVKGAWKQQIETLKRLHAIDGVEAVAGMTLSPFNFDKLESTYTSIQKVLPWFTPKDFHISLMNYSENYYDNWAQKKQELNPLEQEAIREGMIESTKRYKRMIGIPKDPRALLEYLFHKRAEYFLRTGTTPLPCHALKSSCFIDPTGEVYPCITFNHPLGNLRNYSYDLKKIWNLDSTKQLQKKIWNGSCPHCWTGCDGYQTILGNLTRLFSSR